MIRTRFVYFISAAVVAIAGLASRWYRGQLPQFVADYTGDTLRALMLFLLISTLLAGQPILVRAAISLALARFLGGDKPALPRTVDRLGSARPR